MRIHFYEFEDLLPAGDEAQAQHVVHAEGLVGEAAGAAGWSAASGNCCRSSRSFRMSLLPSQATLRLFVVSL